jgi:hypothetical protein
MKKVGAIIFIVFLLYNFNSRISFAYDWNWNSYYNSYYNPYYYSNYFQNYTSWDWNYKSYNSTYQYNYNGYYNDWEWNNNLINPNQPNFVNNSQNNSDWILENTNTNEINNNQTYLNNNYQNNINIYYETNYEETKNQKNNIPQSDIQTILINNQSQYLSALNIAPLLSTLENAKNVGVTPPKIRVAVIDSGIDCNNKAIAPFINYNASKSFISSSSACIDKSGHGTLIAYIISQICGQYCELVSLKVMESQNLVYTQPIISALKEIASWDNKSVAIMSLTTGPDPELMNALYNLRNKTYIVAAAGNNGLDSLPAPAFYGIHMRHLTSVASVENDGSISSYSNRGSAVEIAAFGTMVCGPTPDNGWGCSSGTSFATPQVGAIGALLFALYPQATPELIERVILMGATIEPKLKGVIGSSYYAGEGLIANGGGALTALERIKNVKLISVSPQTPNPGEMIFLKTNENDSWLSKYFIEVKISSKNDAQLIQVTPTIYGLSFIAPSYDEYSINLLIEGAISTNTLLIKNKQELAPQITKINNLNNTNEFSPGDTAIILGKNFICPNCQTFIEMADGRKLTPLYVTSNQISFEVPKDLPAPGDFWVRVWISDSKTSNWVRGVLIAVLPQIVSVENITLEGQVFRPGDIGVVKGENFVSKDCNQNCAFLELPDGTIITPINVSNNEIVFQVPETMPPFGDFWIRVSRSDGKTSNWVRVVLGG